MESLLGDNAVASGPRTFKRSRPKKKRRKANSDLLSRLTQKAQKTI